MTKLCRALFKCENKQKNGLKKLMYNFVVHSNESGCRKNGRLGLEQVLNDALNKHLVGDNKKSFFTK